MPIVEGLMSGMQAVGQGRSNQAQKQAQKANELKKRLETSQDVYDLEQGYIDTMVNDLNLDIKSKINDNTFDINKSLDEDLELRKKSKEIENMAKISLANEKYYQDKKEKYLANPEKYVAGVFDEWEKEYTDPSLTIEDRQTLRIGKDPLEEREDINTLVERPVFPGFSEDRDEKGDYIKYVDEENHAASILRYIQNGKGAKLYEQNKEGNETKEDFAKRMADDFQENYWPDITKHHLPRSRSTGGRTNTTQWAASPAREDQYGGDPSRYNMVVFKAGRATVALQDESGAQYKPISMVAHYDAATGKYIIKAKVKDEEGFEEERTFPVSPNIGEKGHANYEAIQGVLPPGVSLKDLFNKPIDSTQKKTKSPSSKPGGNFPNVDINQ